MTHHETSIVIDLIGSRLEHADCRKHTEHTLFASAKQGSFLLPSSNLGMKKGCKVDSVAALAQAILGRPINLPQSSHHVDTYLAPNLLLEPLIPSRTHPRNLRIKSEKVRLSKLGQLELESDSGAMLLGK